MQIDEIEKTVKQIESLVVGWGGGVTEIERDIVLNKLSELYLAIKTERTVGVKPEKPVAAMPQSARDVTTHIPDNVFDMTQEDAPDTKEEERPLTIEEKNIVEQTVAEVALKETPAVTTNPKVIENSLFNEDQIAIKKPNVDRKVIMSLYGDEPSIIESVSSVDEQSKVVVGDVLNAKQNVVGDVISSRKVDVATRITNSRTTELRQSIGINDKFQMIRDIFNGDSNIYDDAIDKLESMTNLNDALIYIYENHNNNPNSEGAKLLADLLERKLS